MSDTINTSGQAGHEDTENSDTPATEAVRQPAAQNSPAQRVEWNEVLLRYCDKVLSSTRNLWSWVCKYKFEIVGWIAIIIGTIALLPGFRSQDISKMALDLAEWTAFKDYVEYCHESKELGNLSRECELAIEKPLPPPPHVDMEVSKFAQRSVSMNPSERDYFCLVCMQDIVEFLFTSIVLHVINDRFSVRLFIVLLGWAIRVAGLPLLLKRYYILHRAITVFVWLKLLTEHPDWSSWKWVCSWFSRFMLFILLLSELMINGEDEVQAWYDMCRPKT